MQPSAEPADTGYDSISMFHVLHCLPGTMDDKETAIANLKRYLSKTGVLYGVTILGNEAGHNAIGRKLLKIYNDKGIMHNLGDTSRRPAKDVEKAVPERGSPTTQQGCLVRSTRLSRTLRVDRRMPAWWSLIATRSLWLHMRVRIIRKRLLRLVRVWRETFGFAERA